MWPPRGFAERQTDSPRPTSLPSPSYLLSLHEPPSPAAVTRVRQLAGIHDVAIRCQCCQDQLFVLSYHVFKIRLVCMSIPRFLRLSLLPFSSASCSHRAARAPGFHLGIQSHKGMTSFSSVDPGVSVEGDRAGSRLYEPHLLLPGLITVSTTIPTNKGLWELSVLSWAWAGWLSPFCMAPCHPVSSSLIMAAW